MRYAIVILIVILSGCASKKPLSCDGSNRRPINAIQQANVIYPSCALKA